MGLFDFLKHNDSFEKEDIEEPEVESEEVSEKNDEDELDKELDILGLDEKEKELVKKDGWDPYDFEEDIDGEEEDDDYYGEDD
ncbi:MAG: hypothetical protein IJ572_05095 [Bacilli bacterium]|nr:hypothetical protein [Bacilli bacterium]